MLLESLTTVFLKAVLLFDIKSLLFPFGKLLNAQKSILYGKLFNYGSLPPDLSCNGALVQYYFEKTAALFLTSEHTKISNSMGSIL